MFWKALSTPCVEGRGFTSLLIMPQFVLLNDLQSLGLKADNMGTSWKNLPPATVYSVERLSR